MICGASEEEDIVTKTRFINPEGMSKPPGYTHVVEATMPGRIVYIAGQLGAGRDGKVVGDFRAQAVQAFENLKTALAAVGGRFQDVVKFNNYLVDVKYLPVFREVRDGYLAERNRPASTTIAISGLAREGALIEIEAVAVLASSVGAAPAAKKAARSSKARKARSKRK
jgi:enamine deaminase RidA (YjgF/YER057c/UK114 family)